MENAAPTDDPHDLQRFLAAQQESYDRALMEIKHGEKRSHWMWFIFPQFEGLGHSSTARKYAIKSRGEAEAYLAHPVLGERLLVCCEALMAVEGRTAYQVFGYPDDLKLRSCVTLFAEISPPGSVFARVIDRYYDGAEDGATLRLLEDQ